MCVFGLMLLTFFAECSLSVSQDSINTLAVTFHNTKRATEGASDMHKIEYDGGIKNDAQKLADSCHYEHSVPEGQGQNLFFRSKDISVTWLQSEYGATFTSGMEGWYSEKTNYDYATNSKKTGLTSSDLIGHYKQFVLSNVKKIGCAYKVCATLTSDSVTQTNAFYGVCNYDSVVIGSSLPFQKGTPCLLCIPGWCSNDGLCLESCTTGSTECTCPRKCSNNGLLDASKCECSCVGFWKGVTCETPNPCADDSICNSFDPANACDEILTTELEGIINIQVGNK